MWENDPTLWDQASKGVEGMTIPFHLKNINSDDWICSMKYNIHHHLSLPLREIVFHLVVSNAHKIQIKMETV